MADTALSLPQHGRTRLNDSLIWGAGALSFILGAVVIFGWHTHNTRFLQLSPSFVAMAYNTAAGFLLSGLGILTLRAGNPRIATVAATMAFAIGFLTLVEYAGNHDLGIDTIGVKAYVRAGILHFNRMAIATALCFTLSGSVLLLLSVPTRRARTSLPACLAAVVMSLGVIGSTGYFVGATQSYAWGSLTRMALHTALGFVVLGLGLVTLCRQRDPDVNEGSWAALPFIVATGVLAGTISLWQALIVDRDVAMSFIDDLHMAGDAGSPLSTLKRMEITLPTAELLGGILLALLTARVVSQAQTAWSKQRQIASINADLMAARDELETKVAERTRELELANRAVRDVLSSVTDGRFRLCNDRNDLPKELSPTGPRIELGLELGMRALRKQARAAAALAGLSEDRVQDLETAVGEAAMNAVVHCGTGVGWVVMTTGTVQVWVTDTGSGISMESLPRATLERGFTTAGTLGHGFYLMLSTADRVSLLTGPSGTTVVVEKDKQEPAPSWFDRIASPSHPLLADAA